MDRVFSFYKNKEGRWFIDLPEWEGDLDSLEMVSGADVLLDIISFGNDWVNVRFSDKFFEGAKTLVHDRSDFDDGLGWYQNDSWHGPSVIWLCEVTKFVFGGEYPDKIFYN